MDKYKPLKRARRRPIELARRHRNAVRPRLFDTPKMSETNVPHHKGRVGSINKTISSNDRDHVLPAKRRR